MGSLVILLSVLSTAAIVIGIVCLVISLIINNERLQVFGSRLLIGGGIGLFLTVLLVFTLCSTH